MFLLAAEVRHAAPGVLQARQEVSFVLDALILDDLHLFSIRIGFSLTGVI